MNFSTYKSITTDELIEMLKEHPGVKVVLEDPDCCLVVTDRLQVSEIQHADGTNRVCISGWFTAKAQSKKNMTGWRKVK